MNGEKGLEGIAKLGCPHCKKELVILSDRSQEKAPATNEEWKAVMACANHGEFTYQYKRHFGHAQDGSLQGESEYEFWFLEYDYSERKFYWREFEDNDDDSDYED